MFEMVLLLSLLYSINVQKLPPPCPKNVDYCKTDTIFLCGVGFHKKTAQNPTPVVLKGRLIQFISGRSIIDRLRLFERTGDCRRFCKKQVLAAMLRSVENRRNG